MLHLCAEPGLAHSFLEARGPAEQKPQDSDRPAPKDQDWSWPFGLMAHFFPHVCLSDIDEQQMNGYLQHIPALVRMQSEGIASLLTQVMGKG